MAIFEIHVKNDVDVGELLCEVRATRRDVAKLLALAQMSEADREKFNAAAAALDSSTDDLRDVVNASPSPSN